MKIDSRTAHKIVFASLAATRVLGIDTNGVSVEGATLEQFVATAEQDEIWSSSLASVPAGTGTSFGFDAELRGISFTLRVSGDGIIQKGVSWLAWVHFDDECGRP